MQVEDFKTWLADLLEGQPGIDRVEDYEVPDDDHGLTDKVVRGSDGTAFYLRIVRTSPPTGAGKGSGR